MLAASVYLNGDPLDEGVLDNFVYEVKTRHASLMAGSPPLPSFTGFRGRGS
jgi:hypothetical protein